MDTPNAGALDVLLENSRDRRTLDYLVATCGFSRVRKARASLPGRTRPYVSNLAKQLGVAIPEDVLITPRTEGQKRIAEIKRMLSSKLLCAAKLR